MTDASKTSHEFVITPTVAIALLGLIFLWRLFLGAYTNLIPDECSYWAWSRRLDWSYFDNSGMVAYLIRVSTWIFGYSTPFSVRFPFFILSLVSSFLIYSLSVRLFGRRDYGLVTTLAFNVTPVALLGGSAAIHDNALILFTALAMWFMARFMEDDSDHWLYMTGIAIGFSILSKYTGVINLLCVFVFIVCLKKTRPTLLKKSPWIGAAIAMMFTLPIIYWNWLYDWASLSHILFIGSGSASLTRRIEDGLGFNIAQFFLISPFMYVFIIMANVTALWRNMTKPCASHILCLSFGLPLMLFAIQSFRGHVEANWSLPGYIGPCLLAVWSFYSSDAGALNWSAKTWSKKFVRWSIASSIVITGLVVAHAWLGLIPASLERSIAKADRIIWETRDWDKLGEHVSGLVRENEVVAADSYQMCALLEFNIPGQPEVRYLAPWGRPTQFDIWHRSFDDMKGRDIIYVSAKPLAPSTESSSTIWENFASIEPLPVFSVTYHGEPVREIYVYRLKGFDPFQPRRLAPRSLFYRDY